MTNRFTSAPRLLSAACLIAACAAAQAAPDGSAARERYQQDHQACLQGDTAQSRETCLREAGAALQAARAGQLAEQGAANADAYARNGVQRCDVFKEEQDRKACVARVNSGMTEGSVGGGGVLREAVTQVQLPQGHGQPVPAPASPMSQ
ncbi:hypothetical protein M5C99_02375 [Acidovorax sp. NCPPB 2350]|nr:hypothetical protein M5C99_02375 [Acidovorax sp. NCPPB 2350]